MNFDFLLNKIQTDEVNEYININIIDRKTNYIKINIKEIKKIYQKIKNINILSLDIYPNYVDDVWNGCTYINDMAINLYTSKKDYIYIMELLKSDELKKIDDDIFLLQNKKKELLKIIYK